MCASCCVWSSQPWGLGSVLNVTLSVGGLGPQPAELVGVEGPGVMAVGMAPAGLASEVAGFLCVPRAGEVSQAVWESKDAQGGDGTALGVAWEGPGKKAEGRVLGE